MLDCPIGGFDDGISSGEELDEVAHEISCPEKGNDSTDASADKT